MNFIKKYWIFFVIFGLAILLFASMNDHLQEQKTLLNSNDPLTKPEEPNNQALENQEEPNQFQIIKSELELPKPKIFINQADYEQIKNYIFSPDKNVVLTLNSLSPETKNTIDKIKNNWQEELRFLNATSGRCINKYREECDEYKKKCDEYSDIVEQTQQQIPPLEQQRQQKEAPLAAKTKEIKKAENELTATSNIDARTRLRNKILELGNEKTKIIQEIADITVRINSLKRRSEENVKDVKHRRRNERIFTTCSR